MRSELPIGLDARKPADQLTLEDLATFPIWEFADDEESVGGRDETWVRPLNARIVSRDRQASLNVAADFETASGRRLDGFVGLSVAVFAQDEVEVNSAVVIDGGVCVFAWPTRDGERAEVAAKLGLGEEELFQLKYHLRVLVRGEGFLRHGALNEPPPPAIRIPTLRRGSGQ